ncbi:hypothetical protein ABMA58_20290, partial [Oceanospirillum sp. HFRX-1_2]
MLPLKRGVVVVSVAIVVYPDSLKSAVYGLEEMFILANRVAGELGQQVAFEPKLIRFDEQGFSVEAAVLNQEFQVV